MTKNAAIYTRISEDRDGTEQGVKRQREDCEELCNRNGWNFNHYEDNDISAWSGKDRPGWNQLLADLNEGKVDVVVAWKLDRVTREGIRAIGPLLDALKTNDATLVTVTEHIDTTNAIGEGTLGFLASMAKQASDDASLRIKRALLQNAKSGKPHKGGKRPFGYQDDLVTVHPIEGKVFKQLVQRFLAGETVYSLANWLNENGHVTPYGKPWRTDALRNCLCNPRYAGFLRHNGIVVGQGDWASLITLEQHETIKSMVVARKIGALGPRKGKKLLTGILKCPCGGNLTSQAELKRGYNRYKCTVPGKGHTQVYAHAVEPIVIDMMFAHIDSDEFRNSVAKSAQAQAGTNQSAVDLTAELSAARAKIDELEAMFADGDLSGSEYKRLRNRLNERVAKASSALNRLPTAGVLVPDAATLRISWDAMNVHERRAVLAQVFERIDIAPFTVHIGPKFDSARLNPVFRYGPE